MTVKTEDHAKTMIVRHWDPSEWTCSNSEVLKQVVEEAEDEADEA